MHDLEQLLRDRDELTKKIAATRRLSLSLFAQRRALDRVINKGDRSRAGTRAAAGLTGEDDEHEPS